MLVTFGACQAQLDVDMVLSHQESGHFLILPYSSFDLFLPFSFQIKVTGDEKENISIKKNN